MIPEEARGHQPGNPLPGAPLGSVPAARPLEYAPQREHACEDVAGPSLRCLAGRDRKGAAVTASPRAAAAQRRTLKAEEFDSAAAARRPARPAGEILAPQRLAAATAGSSAWRDMQGRACGDSDAKHPAHPPEALIAGSRRPICPGPSKSWGTARIGRVRPTATIAASTSSGVRMT